MSDNESDKSGAGGGAGSGPKRPARTIELEADEVEIEAKDAEDARDEDAGEDTAGEDTAAKHEAAAEQPDNESDSDGADAAAADSDASKTDDEPRPSGLPPRTPPRQRARPSDIRTFVTHLAAGLVGGLIGVIGAGIGLDKLPFTNFTGATGVQEETARIEQRLGEIASRQEELASSLEAAPKSDALNRIESRLEKVEARPAPEPAVPEEIGNRLAKLEGTLENLQNAAGGEGATGLEQSAALTARIDAVSEDLERRAASLSQDIARTREMLEAQPAPQPAGESDAVKALDRRLAGLEKKLAAFAEQPVSASPRAGSNAAALALAFENLQRAADRGEPYAAELDALGKLAGADVDVAALATHAREGVPSETTLLARLPEVLRAARAAAARSDDETFLDRLASNAQSVVRVRRIGPREGDTAAAVLSRMEARMKESDLSGVISEAKSLEGAAREAVQPWLTKAQARRDLDKALAAARAKLLASLGDSAPAQPVR